jgi:hypothetical protein
LVASPLEQPDLMGLNYGFQTPAAAVAAYPVHGSLIGPLLTAN